MRRCNLLVVLPLYLLLPRAAARRGDRLPPRRRRPSRRCRAAWVRRSFLLLAVFFTLRAVISATLSVQLIAAARRARPVGRRRRWRPRSLMGPAQVGGRLLEFTLGRAAHPLTAARLGGAAAAARRAAAGAGRAGGGGALRADLRRQQRHHDHQPRRGAAGAVRAARLPGADGPAGAADPAGPGRRPRC